METQDPVNTRPFDPIELADSVGASLEEALVRIGEKSPVGNVLRFFRFKHLPPNLRIESSRFAQLALWIAAASSNPETTAALRKLLEAKDCAVRAVLP